MISGTSIVLFHFISIFFFFPCLPLPPPLIPSAAMDCAESNCDTRKNKIIIIIIIIAQYGNNIRSNPTGIEMAFTNSCCRSETKR